MTTDEMPRWDVTDLHESFEARSFLEAMDRVGADAARLEAMFDEYDIRATEPRPVTPADGVAADATIRAVNDFETHVRLTAAYIYATTSTNSYDEKASGLLAEYELAASTERHLMARLADWTASLGVDALAGVSTEVAEHRGPLSKLAARADHQMSELEERLYAELATSGSSAWSTLQGVVTSQLSAEVVMPDGPTRLPIAAVRGLASNPDPAVRQAAYEAELAVWPTVAPTCAAALNGIKGEAITVNRLRHWASPLDASLFSNSVSRPTFNAMQEAITTALPDMRRWMRAKARVHGRDGALPWYDLFAPVPFASSAITFDQGLDIVRNAFAAFGGSLAGIVDRAVDQRWIDAEPRDGKLGGAFCMPFVDDRSLVLLNWSGNVEDAQIAAHELGHAYHNTQLAARTPLQRALPMSLAETASIFCETLVVEEGLARLEGRDRLALLNLDLVNATQVIVDIRSRFLFETEVFARRQRRTLGVTELNELMLQAQHDAYGDGLEQTTAHRFMWALKSHYYGSHFYNWPYTYGMLFGLGLYAQYQADPDRFRVHYDDALSRVGMATAEELAATFGFDVTSTEFWTASLDVVRERIASYEQLAVEVT